jgi:crossover junction endodeoxyribonuclease RuvC
MRILGIDPGTVVIGYGVIDGTGDSVLLVECGALKSSARLPISERLSELYRQVSDVISLHRPDVVAIEQPFVARNVNTALAIGKAQAIAILAAANHGIPVYEYTPAQVKQRVTNYGTSSKEQVQKMVSLQLGIAEVPGPSDVADALATALCHLGEAHVSGLLVQES